MQLQNYERSWEEDERNVLSIEQVVKTSALVLCANVECRLFGWKTGEL